MDKVGCDLICKSHSARSDRDQYRICPTKLTKPELEHLYFALLENNFDLKKTVNEQQDKIKVLSTKVQRITSAQKVLQAEEKKDCCLATKLVVNQQKELITDLKRANERMAERIRKLNMRLCSAKQFCKSATPRCLRCSTATSPYLIKHSPTSYKHQSQSTLKFAVSCQNLSRETTISRYVQTESSEISKHKEEKSCEDNKCKTLFDELKQKIVNLQEELTLVHNESASHVSSLECELQQTRGENVRVRSERVAAEHELARKEERIAHLVTNLRAAEALSTELKTELSIEKRKVAELETRLKAATMSNRMTQTIEDTLTSIQESNKSTATDITLTCACSPRHHIAEPSAQLTCTGLSAKDISYCDESKLSKSADDSGYIDANKSQNLLDDQSLNKIIEELTNRILVLQTQVDSLTISPPEEQGSKAKTMEDHSTTTEDYSNVPTEIESSQLVPKTNSKVTSNINIENPKEISKEEPVLNVDIKPVDEDTSPKIISPKQDQHYSRTSSPIPIQQSGQSTSWIAGVTKLNVVNKITSEKDHKNKENVRKSNAINIVEKSNDPDKDINKSEDGSTSIEDKTYNVPIKDKNVVNVDKKEPVKGQINNKLNKNVIEKENNAGRKDQFVRQDTNKSDNKGKTDGQKTTDSPKRLVTGKQDVEKNTNQKEYVAVSKIKMHKSVEQKTTARAKKLVRAQTEIQHESTCEEITYTVDKSLGDNSADNTDSEISSLTDLPEEREPKSPTRNLLSPGEQKYPSTQTDSIASPSTNYSLSEGEIPITSARRKSNEDNPRTEHCSRPTVPKMEETLQAITDELARCKRLLFSQRSHDSIMPSVSRNDNKSPNNSASVKRWASTS